MRTTPILALLASTVLLASCGAPDPEPRSGPDDAGAELRDEDPSDEPTPAAPTEDASEGPTDDDPTGDDPTEGPAASLAGEWTLQEGTLRDTDIEPIPGASITLTPFPDDCYRDVDCWNGRDGCNIYTVRVDWRGGDDHQLGEWSVDDMMCHPAEVHEVADRYREALFRTTTFSFEEDDLVLEGQDVVLRFTSAPGPP